MFVLGPDIREAFTGPLVLWYILPINNIIPLLLLEKITSYIDSFIIYTKTICLNTNGHTNMQPTNILFYFLPFPFQLEEFLSLSQDLGSAKQAFHQAREKTTANIAWIKDNYHSISDWLNAV